MGGGVGEMLWRLVIYLFALGLDIPIRGIEMIDKKFEGLRNLDL